MTPSSPTRRSSDLPGDVGYHAAKAGIVGLTRATAIDTAAAGITVNAVAPGWIDTASASAYERRLGAATPVGRSGTADEVAHAIVFLASEGASYITGQPITVAGATPISEDRGRCVQTPSPGPVALASSPGRSFARPGPRSVPAPGP